MQKSIDFLLEHAGPVIQYRLRRDILHSLTPDDEDRLLKQIEQLPLVELLKTYVQPNGYIGRGMHSWDNWRGEVLHQTPLQDGEAAARLLSYYGFSKNHPLVACYAAALNNEATLRDVFSYIPPETARFENRLNGLNNGNCLMTLVYTMLAMLGYGDDKPEICAFQQIALKGFQRLLQASSLEEITHFDPASKRRYNYPFIEADDLFPNAYTLALLAYTKNWRTEENILMMADALNHICKIMKPENNLHVRLNGKYVVPYAALVRPLRAFHPDLIDSILYRRTLTEIAMLGVGKRVDILRQSAEYILSSMDDAGVVHMNFEATHNKRYSPKKIVYPTPYNDVKLEADYRVPHAWSCDLTFWAIELLHLIN